MLYVEVARDFSRYGNYFLIALLMTYYSVKKSDQVKKNLSKN